MATKDVAFILLAMFCEMTCTLSECVLRRQGPDHSAGIWERGTPFSVISALMLTRLQLGMSASDFIRAYKPCAVADITY
jgi:hypothetical protein